VSSSTEVIGEVKPSRERQWSLWAGQIAAIMRLEVRKNFIGKRAILIYLLAAVPILLMAALSAEISWQQSRNSNIGEINIIFANLYEGLILRTIIFFGCAWIFMNLFRGEVVDRSLHYYFLSPLRREVLVREIPIGFGCLAGVIRHKHGRLTVIFVHRAGLGRRELLCEWCR